MPTSKKQRRNSIQNSDPGKILDLVMSLDDDSCWQLQAKINKYLQEECEAELVLMIIVHVNGERLEAYIETVGIHHVQRKMRIDMTKKLTEILESNSEAIELLSNFDGDFKAIVTPFLTNDQIKRRAVILPIHDEPFSIIVCAIAPKVEEELVVPFIYECFLFAWPTLKKGIALEYERTLKQKCQQLLRVAKRLFSHVASLDSLLQVAMEQAKSLVKAEYCSVKLVDLDKMDLAEIKMSYCILGTEKEVSGRRFPMNMGIAGTVLKTGTIVNLKNPQEHPDFNPEIDTLPDIECKNLLCFPIRDQSGIIGVGYLFNKVMDPYFDAMDEELALAFSTYCGVCIVHSMVYQKIQEAHIRNALAHELIMYYMKVKDAEVDNLLTCKAFHNHPHVNTLHFNFKVLPTKELPCYAYKFFIDLDFYKTFNLKPAKLARFILHVQKGYRDVPYHNWFHAWNVAQWAYAAIINFKLVQRGYLTELQAFMYVLAGLVHDLDHRGTSNSFQIQGQTNLAALYSSEGSVMERHHLSQAMCILNTEGCDILEGLPRREYDRAIMLLRDYILASDLSNYFKRQRDFYLISNQYIKHNKVHSAALMAMLMNCADLSDQLKDWGSVKKTASAVLTEFFQEGDLEKRRGELPIMIMDREKCFIPVLEAHFLKSVCIPLFEAISKILPKAEPCLKIIENHIERWEAAIPVFSEVPITAGLSVLVSPELDTLIEINLKEKERLAGEEEQHES